MKIDGLVERIFAQAVALDQSGGLRNTIYALGKEIFILNYDHTVLLRFKLRPSEVPFEHPISFRANDYDSNEFEEEDGKIIFITNQHGFQKRKSCGTPGLSPSDVQSIYHKYVGDEVGGETIRLHQDVLSSLESNLSHIEFSGQKGGKLKMIQRNIYSGAVIEVERREGKGFFKEELGIDFGPIALRTNDFSALFNFEPILDFTFPAGVGKGDDYIIIKSVDQKKRDVSGVVACCLYDEIIEIREAKGNRGRKKSKIRRR